MSDEPMMPIECNTCGGTGELAAHLGGVQTLAADLCPDCNPEARLYAEAKKRGMELAKRFEIGSSDDANQAAIDLAAEFVGPPEDRTPGVLRHFAEESNLVEPAEPIGDGIVWTEDDCFVAPDYGEQTTIVASNPYENVEPGQTVHTVSPEVGEVLQAQAKRITDLEVMLEAQRQLTANAVADVERQQAGERARRIELEQVSRARKWAIDALIEALVPFASFSSEEDGNIRGMTEPVCLSMAAVRRADALVKLHQALR